MPLISADQAFVIIAKVNIAARPIRPAWLWDAPGCVLAEDVLTARDIPPFNRSAMDGYAVHSADLQNLPVTLQVQAVREAGEDSHVSIERGKCAKIMTGAAVPQDTDAVVMIENTRSDNAAQHATILKPVKPFENIACKGEDAPADAAVLRKGQLLTGQALAVAAGSGRAMLKVHPQPEVAILATGGELVEPGHLPDGNKIYNSNATLLAGLIGNMGTGTAHYLGICRDDRRQLTKAIQMGLDSDLLLITGGLSKGDFDFVPRLLHDCGIRVHFHGVAIKPGKPLLFGSTADGHYVFGLPGNPVSVMVCFYEFVLPLLRRLAGMRDPIFSAALKATLTTPVSKKPGRKLYCSARLHGCNGQLYAEPTSGHGSGDYVAVADANGVIILSEQSSGAQASQEVLVHSWQMPLEYSREDNDDRTS